MEVVGLLNSCLKYLSEFDLQEFRTTVHLTDSKKDNVQKLVEVTNYFRKVMMIFKLVLQNIRAKHSLITREYNYCKESLEHVETSIIYVTDKSHVISKKFAQVTEKNKELLTRTQYVTQRIRNNQTQLNEAEKHFENDLQMLTLKTNFLASDIDNFHLKRDAIETFKKQHKHCNDTSYFKDWQVNLVKEHVLNIGIGIKHLLDEITVIKNTLNKD